MHNMSTLTHPIFSGPPQAPPKDFDPSKASDSELQKYFYPPRPDPAKAPLESAIWESFSARKPRFVKAEGDDSSSEDLSSNKNWAGGFVQASDTQDGRLNYVTGTFNAPKLTPSSDVETGSYEVGSWVGIDGRDSNDGAALKAGVLSKFEVVNGKPTPTVHEALLLFHGREEGKIHLVTFSLFHVLENDRITVHLWAAPGTRGPFYATVWNITQSIYSTEKVDPRGERLEGREALWIFGGRDHETTNILFPKFDNHFWGALTTHRDDAAGTEVLSGDGGTFDSASHPIRVNPNGRSGLSFLNLPPRDF